MGWEFLHLMLLFDKFFILLIADSNIGVYIIRVSQKRKKDAI